MRHYTYHTDNALLELLRQGNEEAFTEIYHRYWERVYAISYHFFKERQVAEDLVQQLFLSIWSRREVLEVRSLENYLASAAKYLVLQQRIKTSRRAALMSLQPVPNEAFPGDEQLLVKFLQNDINQVLEKLPDTTRIIYRYSREANLSAREIADNMNISVKTVEAHITRALKALRYSLRDIHFFLF